MEERGSRTADETRSPEPARAGDRRPHHAPHRGFGRRQDFEVTRHNDPAPGKCKPNNCSLREAIRAANASAGKDAVALPDRGRYVLKRTNATPVDEDESRRGDLDVTGKLTLSHPGSGQATIDANGIDRVLDVLATTVVKRIKLTGGDNPNDDPPTPPRAVVRRGAGGDGGGIIMHAPLTLTRSSVIGNEGAEHGGGIESYPLVKGNTIPLRLNRSKVARNATTTGLGGGLDTIETRVSLVRSKVVGNEAGNAGAGVTLFLGDLRMNRTTVARNRSGSGAAGVYLTEADGKISNSTISNNATVGNSSGGGIDADAQLTVTNSTVAGNSATNDAGGIRISGSDGDLVLRSSTIVRNLADSDGVGGGTGGGIVQETGGTATVVNSIIALNRRTERRRCPTTVRARSPRRAATC